MNSNLRSHQIEQLDNLSLSGSTLKKALSSLKLINSLFGNHKYLNTAIQQYCQIYPNKEQFHVVDLGCGGGDCIYAISKKAKKKGIKISFTGIDGNPQSISYAQSNNVDKGSIDFITTDILNENFELPQCDILISSHFIYHFEDDELVKFLQKVQSKNVKHVIFSELYRSRRAYYLFKVARHIMPISDMAKKDGLLAIQRAFSTEELKKIIVNSNIKNFKIIKKPFFRTITLIDLQK